MACRHPSPQHPSPQHPSPRHPSPQHPSPQHPSPQHPPPIHCIVSLQCCDVAPFCAAVCAPAAVWPALQLQALHPGSYTQQRGSSRIGSNCQQSTGRVVVVQKCGVMCAFWLCEGGGALAAGAASWSQHSAVEQPRKCRGWQTRHKLVGCLGDSITCVFCVWCATLCL